MSLTRTNDCLIPLYLGEKRWMISGNSQTRRKYYKIFKHNAYFKEKEVLIEDQNKIIKYIHDIIYEGKFGFV